MALLDMLESQDLDANDMPEIGQECDEWHCGHLINVPAPPIPWMTMSN
jgi:hypothetical protein